MTERSRFWDGTSPGDATEAPYDAAVEFANVIQTVSGTGARVNKGGVSFGERSNLDHSVVGGAVRIQPGTAVVHGTWYDSDANIDHSIPTPSTATRIDRVILRKSWASKTVRQVRLEGTEGGGAPSLTQTVGVTWEIPLYQVSITTGGAITVTDEREGATGGTGGVPSTIEVGDTADPGSSGIPADSSHVHAVPAPSAPPAMDFGAAASAGSGTQVARANHVHNTPNIFRRRKPSTQTVNGNASVVGNEITGLSFPVLSGKSYLVDITIFYSSGTTPDIKFDVTVPGGSSYHFSYIGPDVTTPTTVVMDEFSAGEVAFGGDSANLAVQFSGVVVAGSNGNFNIRFAQNTADFTNTSVLENSRLAALEV